MAYFKSLVLSAFVAALMGSTAVEAKPGGAAANSTVCRYYAYSPSGAVVGTARAATKQDAQKLALSTCKSNSKKNDCKIIPDAGGCWPSIQQQAWDFAVNVPGQPTAFGAAYRQAASSAGPLYTQTMALYYCAVQVDKAAVDAQYPNGTDDIPSKGGAGDAARKFLGQYCQVVKQVDGTPEGQ